jgi:hypothetical protein
MPTWTSSFHWPKVRNLQTAASGMAPRTVPSILRHLALALLERLKQRLAPTVDKVIASDLPSCTGEIDICDFGLATPLVCT